MRTRRSTRSGRCGCSRRRAPTASSGSSTRRRPASSASSRPCRFDEQHPIDPDTPYGASKLAGEKLCLAYGKLYPLEAVCLRYFNVYGVHQRYDAYGNVIPIFAHRVLAGEPVRIFGDGEQTRDLVNVRDVAEANFLAGTAPAVSGAFNVASGTRVTINALARMVFEAAGVPPKIEVRAAAARRCPP